MDTQALIILYLILVALTIVFAALKKTSWWSILGVAVIPIFFLFVLWDVLQSLSQPAAAEGDPGIEGQPEKPGR